MTVTIGDDLCRRVTVDGDRIEEITIDGDRVFSEFLIDDFEDQNLDEYENDTSDFYISKSASYRFNYGLVGDNSGYIYSTSGLSNYPSRGDTFTFWAKLVTNADHTSLFFPFALQNPSGDQSGYGDAGYSACFFHNADDTYTFAIRKDINGEDVAVDYSINLSGGLGDWYKIKVIFGDPTIEAKLIDTSGDVHSYIYGDDTSYDSGGIGFIARREVHFDYAKVLG